MWSVISKLLLLSHGQATVERGFSINRQEEVENLVGESHIALRFIVDTVNSLGGNVLDVHSAHRRHKASLEHKRKMQASEERNALRNEKSC